MPIVTAYSGSINVTANETFASSPFYEQSKTLYGETLGEIFDNVVEASINLTRDTQNWVLANRPADYNLSDDYWQVQITLPDVFKCLKEKIPSDIDSALSFRVTEFREIFSYAVCNRDSLILVAVTHLQLLRPGISAIPTESKRRLEEMAEADTYEDMLDIGWTGKELDSILEIAQRENRITTLRAFDKYESRLAAFEMESSKTANGSKTVAKKKKWWRFKE